MYYVTRGPGEEYNNRNLKPTFKSKRTSISIWSCFCGDKISLLVIIPKGSTITAKHYTKTLRKYFILFYKRMKRKYKPRVVMQEDNTSWHKIKFMRVFLARQKVKYLS
jgi:hypothetical protein